MWNWKTRQSGYWHAQASYQQENWKQAFWGSNYEKLSQIKTKYDPNNILWVSPGINADAMENRNGRICKASTVTEVSDVKLKLGAAPKSDNDNFANPLTDYQTLFGDLEMWGGFPVEGFQEADLKVTAV
jgi:hypothetical protein